MFSRRTSALLSPFSRALPFPSAARRRQHTLFHELLRSLRAASLSPFPLSADGSGAAVAPDAAPLAASARLMEELGVLDAAARRRGAAPAKNENEKAKSEESEEGEAKGKRKATREESEEGGAKRNEKSRAGVSAAAVADVCRAGVGGGASPHSVLRRVRDALPPQSVLPRAAVAVLVRSASERLSGKAEERRRCAKGEIVHFAATQPRADQGAAARMRCALNEEVRRAYELLAMIGAQSGEEEKKTEAASDVVEEIRARVRLAAALQDSDMATRAAHALLAALKHKDNSVVAEDMAAAISAFTHSRDFTSASTLYELYAAKLPSDNDGNHARLTLLPVLADCVGSNAAHFSYVRESVVGLFTLSEVAYTTSSRLTARHAVCRTLYALARVALKPTDKMLIALTFFRSVQRSSHADVCNSYEITEALLRVASAARDGSVALVLYNQLVAPHMGRANVPSNLEALLIAEKDPACDTARLISFMGMGRLVLSSSAVQLLAAKLLLAGRPSEEVYTALDSVEKRSGRDGQRTFMLRLLTFLRDLAAAKNRVPNPTRACCVLKEWREELHQSEVRTASLTALAILQQIHCRLTDLAKVESETLPLVELVDSLLVELSQGWLRHRATPNRTPLFYKTAEDLHLLLSNPTRPAHLVTLRSGLFTDCLHCKESFSHDLVQNVFESLTTTSAATDADAVITVVGLIDYACLCLAEDSHRSIAPSRFSLDSMNSQRPLVYVTDALGELILRESSNVDRTIEVPVSSWNNFQYDAVKDWLSLWLKEIDTPFAPCGEFELQLEELIREAQYSKSSTALSTESDKESELNSAFVAIHSEALCDYRGKSKTNKKKERGDHDKIYVYEGHDCGTI